MLLVIWHPPSFPGNEERTFFCRKFRIAFFKFSMRNQIIGKEQKNSMSYVWKWLFLVLFHTAVMQTNFRAHLYSVECTSALAMPVPGGSVDRACRCRRQQQVQEPWPHVVGFLCLGSHINSCDYRGHWGQEAAALCQMEATTSSLQAVAAIVEKQWPQPPTTTPIPTSGCQGLLRPFLSLGAVLQSKGGESLLNYSPLSLL